jgi:hypothetical protein
MSRMIVELTNDVSNPGQTKAIEIRRNRVRQLADKEDRHVPDGGAVERNVRFSIDPKK